jgi:hypothetical protein
MPRFKLPAGDLLIRLSLAMLMATVAVAPVGSTSVAQASGGLDSGGSGGGGGGSTPPPVLVPCAQISSFKATGGNYQTYGAIWVSYTVKNCGPDEFLTVTVTETTAQSANVWSYPSTAYLKNGSSFSMGNIDNDFALPGTTYHVVITVRETATGTLLATQSADATTGIKIGA